MRKTHSRGVPSQVGILIARLTSPCRDRRLAAVRQLAALGEAACTRAERALQKALRDECEAVRAAAAETLGILGKFAPEGALRYSLLDDPCWNVRAAAAQALGGLEERVPIEYLVMALEWERDWSVREAIVRALGRQKIARPATVEALLRVLRADETGLVREAAAWALGKMQSPGAREALTSACGDADDEVRHAAILALQQLAGK